MHLSQPNLPCQVPSIGSQQDLAAPQQCGQTSCLKCIEEFFGTQHCFTATMA